jgi:hypothetical protein
MKIKELPVSANAAETNPIIRAFEAIARETLGIETLETRRSDRLDFHDVSVWGVLEALTRAYELGRQQR